MKEIIEVYSGLMRKHAILEKIIKDLDKVESKVYAVSTKCSKKNKEEWNELISNLSDTVYKAKDIVSTDKDKEIYIKTYNQLKKFWEDYKLGKVKAIEEFRLFVLEILSYLYKIVANEMESLALTAKELNEKIDN